MKRQNTLVAALLAAWLVTPATAAPASATEASDAPQAVFVAGTHNPDWKSYKAFLTGMKLFDEKHALAPAAPLRFVLSPRVANATLDGVRMNIEDDDGRKIPVAIEADGTFVLPRDEDAARAGAEILLNKKRKTLSWRPDFRTPGVPDNARRMGDLRLECFVRWSIEQADLIAFFRSTINAFGGPCTSAAIKVDYISVKPLAAVYIVSGARREKLPDKWIEEEGHVYLPPLHDTSWPDDTLVQFEYR